MNTPERNGRWALQVGAGYTKQKSMALSRAGFFLAQVRQKPGRLPSRCLALEGLSFGAFLSEDVAFSELLGLPWPDLTELVMCDLVYMISNVLVETQQMVSPMSGGTP